MPRTRLFQSENQSSQALVWALWFISLVCIGYGVYSGSWLLPLGFVMLVTFSLVGLATFMGASDLDALGNEGGVMHDVATPRAVSEVEPLSTDFELPLAAEHKPPRPADPADEHHAA